MSENLKKLEDNRDIEIWVQNSMNGGWALLKTLSPKREKYIVNHKYFFGLFNSNIEYEKSLESHLSLRGKAYEIAFPLKDRTIMKTKKIVWMQDYDESYLSYDGFDVIWDSAKGGWQ